MSLIKINSPVILMSVIYNNYDVFRYNLYCVFSQNNHDDFIILIIDNSDNLCTAFVEFIENKKNIIYIRNDRKPNFNFKKGSFHHAIALDLGIKYIKENITIYSALIVMDPDYFIFGENWVNVLCARMINSEVSFIGSPWASRWKNKYKNFPCVQFMIINEKLVDQLPTFSPIDDENIIIFNFWRVIYSSDILSHYIAKIMDHVYDTGSVIFQKFKLSRFILFNEIFSSDLFNSDFEIFKNKFKPIYNAIIKYNILLELYEFDSLKMVHFRSYGNEFDASKMQFLFGIEEEEYRF
jgi:hypothetical protein